jgi:hypothetical protein
MTMPVSELQLGVRRTATVLAEPAYDPANAALRA